MMKIIRIKQNMIRKNWKLFSHFTVELFPICAIRTISRHSDWNYTCISITVWSRQHIGKNNIIIKEPFHYWASMTAGNAENGIMDVQDVPCVLSRPTVS